MKTKKWMVAMLALLMAAPILEAQRALGPGKEDEATPAAQIRRLFAQGRWREGVAALEEAEKVLPGNEDLQFMRAMVAMETGDYGEAMRLYLKLLEKYPDNAVLKNNVAWLRVVSRDPQIHNLDLALKEAQEAVMAADQDYNIWNTLGEVYLARGDAMRAMRLAVLARDMAAMAGERDLRVYQDLVRRTESAGR